MREPIRGKDHVGILAALVTIAAAIFAPASIAKTHHRCDGLKGKRHFGCRTRWHPKPSARLSVATASWYGPADSGGALACTGATLTSSTQGVANRTLPCGTRLTVCAARCVQVRVVDRGPYIAGRDFDLTEATARATGFIGEGVGPIRYRIE